MSVDKQYITKFQGKDFVLFAGLLDLAHKQGLSGVETSIVQIPNKDNGHLAIVQAKVTTDKGTFTGIGDASPDNVNKMIAKHVLRMAETRAIARAMRTATNVGITAFEELGEDETATPAPTLKAKAKLGSEDERKQNGIDKCADLWLELISMDSDNGPSIAMLCEKSLGLPTLPDKEESDQVSLEQVTAFYKGLVAYKKNLKK